MTISNLILLYLCMNFLKIEQDSIRGSNQLSTQLSSAFHGSASLSDSESLVSAGQLDVYVDQVRVSGRFNHVSNRTDLLWQSFVVTRQGIQTKIVDSESTKTSF